MMRGIMSGENVVLVNDNVDSSAAERNAAIEKSIGKHSVEQHSTGQRLHELAEHRQDPEYLEKSFRSDESPYRTKITRSVYEKNKTQFQVNY